MLLSRYYFIPWYKIVPSDFELYYIPIFHNIVFAFHSELALFARGGVASCLQKFVPFNHLRTDEFILEVGMNCLPCYGRCRALLYRPSSRLILSCGEISFQSKQFVAGFDEIIKPCAKNWVYFDERPRNF